jgi:hypothetical protein
MSYRLDSMLASCCDTDPALQNCDLDSLTQAEIYHLLNHSNRLGRRVAVEAGFDEPDYTHFLSVKGTYLLVFEDGSLYERAPGVAQCWNSWRDLYKDAERRKFYDSQKFHKFFAKLARELP